MDGSESMHFSDPSHRTPFMQLVEHWPVSPSFVHSYDILGLMRANWSGKLKVLHQRWGRRSACAFNCVLQAITCEVFTRWKGSLALIPLGTRKSCKYPANTGTFGNPPGYTIRVCEKIRSLAYCIILMLSAVAVEHQEIRVIWYLRVELPELQYFEAVLGVVCSHRLIFVVGRTWFWESGCVAALHEYHKWDEQCNWYMKDWEILRLNNSGRPRQTVFTTSLVRCSSGVLRTRKHQRKKGASISPWSKYTGKVRQMKNQQSLKRSTSAAKLWFPEFGLPKKSPCLALRHPSRRRPRVP